MLRITVITLLLVGAITYLGFYGYRKVMNTTFASNVVNFNNVVAKDNARLMTIINCSPGNIPFLASFNATINIQPYSISISPGSKVRIVNSDSVSHTIGIADSKVWEAIESGDFIDVDTTELPSLAKWIITCDGINLGDSGPFIKTDIGI